MPIYEYQCRACGHCVEILQRMGEGAKGLACPNCRRKALDKQCSTFAASVAGAVASTASACEPGRFT